MSILNFQRSQLGMQITTNDESDECINLEFLAQPIASSLELDILGYEVLSSVSNNFGEVNDAQAFFENINDETIKAVFLAQLATVNSIDRHKTGIKSPLMSLNLTLSCLEDERFIEAIVAMTIAPFAIEINEHSLTTLNKRALQNARKLQRLGHELWLDDYKPCNDAASRTLGTINWDRIKVDKTFLYKSIDNLTQITTLTRLLKRYSSKGVIVEGIESLYQRECVATDSVYIQGYLLGYPKTLWNREMLLEEGISLDAAINKQS
ncbi:EAL domain-containing protein [Vibrio mediterranei]|uniref:EAL domain-containing protein n=1 Tax=Vibrio mediterranei TaxID=689 RepID=UPI000D181E65|nr:EAL domain-containing protein [Vibrio mediterranei]MCG9656783.1 EAL domain-containing protein [Vibrio mediterranei]PTC01900.1 EAL domain-containing protein [Vibrio mediterranei]